MEDKLDKAELDRRIAVVLARRHGVITAAQLAQLGLGRKGVSARVRAHTLYRLYRGVYSVVHPNLLSRKGHWLAAVGACGPGAVLSHRSAAALQGTRPQSSGPIEVTVPSTNGRANRDGIRIHRSTSLDPADLTEVDAIPVTTPRRTIADLRRVLPLDHIRAMIRRAEILRLDIGHQPGYEDDRTRNDLEKKMVAICKRHGLPSPEVNVWIDPYKVDFLWREQRLIVETDGFETHGTRSSFEADRARDTHLTLHGFTVLRFTHRQVFSQSDHVATSIQALLFLPS